jgi:hypothetical protein
MIAIAAIINALTGFGSFWFKLFISHSTNNKKQKEVLNEKTEIFYCWISGMCLGGRFFAAGYG